MSTDILSPEFLDSLDRVQPEVEEIYRYADLTGVFLMGLVGGTIARQKGYDIIGFLFLALFSALGGGMLRDALIQKGTVAAIAEREYLILAFSGALIAWLAHFKGRLWDRFQAHADAVISGAWAVTGAAKALTWDLSFLAALFMGVLTATGGSMIRDVVTGERPKAFGGGQLVVAPALVAASVYAVFHHLDEPVLGMIVGAVAGTALAIVSYWFGWHFPANPDFAPANTAAREARELAEAAGEKTMDVAAEVEPKSARRWRHEHDIVRKADEDEAAKDPGKAGATGCRQADEDKDDGQEGYRFEDVLRELHEDDSPEGRRAEREFIAQWLGWRQEQEAKE